MTESQGEGRGLLAKGERVLSHILAVVVGFVLMVVGLGLGVTMVLLPIGFVVGLAGAGLFVWGLVGHLKKAQ